MNDALFKIAVSAFLLENKKLLIVRRAAKVDFLSGYWEVPGGGVEPNETIEEALLRELWEEVGLLAVSGSLFGYFAYLNRSDQKTIHLNFLCSLALSTQQIRLHSQELSECAWITLEELNQYEMTVEMREACKQAFAKS